MSVHREPGVVRFARRCWLNEADLGDLATLCAEVVRSSPPDTVVIGATAARLHGLWLPDGLDAIEVATTTPGRPVIGMTRTRRPEIRTRRVALTDDEVTTIGGIRVTTRARTWRDLATTLGLPALVAAGDSALRAGTDVIEIAQTLSTGRHVRGIRRARAAADLLDGRSRSRPESHLRVAACSGGRLAFAVNEPIPRFDGGWLAEPDLSLLDAKLALEYQGKDHASVERMRRDMTRFADLRAEGWLVFPYGPAEVFGRPWSIEIEVLEAVRRRAPHLLQASR